MENYSTWTYQDDMIFAKFLAKTSDNLRFADLTNAIISLTGKASDHARECAKITEKSRARAAVVQPARLLQGSRIF
jgi:hypothetical protein